MADLSKLADELSSLTVLQATQLAKVLENKWQAPTASDRTISVADIKKDFPDWPNEVIAEWFLYFANEPDLGWPPPEPLGDHRWGRILGGRPTSWWKKVSWQKEAVECTPAKLSEKSRGIVITMIAEINNGTADATTRRRFKSAMDYILDNGTFPGAMVTMQVPSGLTVLDGSHRMGAFCGAQLMPDAAFDRLQKKRPALGQEVWVGRHPDGEVPLT